MYPVIEYPKSGGTWLCRMLALSLRLPFAQYARLPVAMPCVVHGHWRHHRRLQNITYLTRDGRDVIVSFYFHFNRPTDSPNYSDKDVYMRKMRTILGPGADPNDVHANLPRFIEYIFENPIACKQNWRDHNRSWLRQDGVCPVKYEDLRENCESTLAGLIECLGRPVDSQRVRDAVEHFSMQRMTGRAPGEEDKESFIRKGIVGDWKNYFTQESARLFNELAGDMLIELGYESDHAWVSQL